MNDKAIWLDISAEFLLNYLYPEKKDQWIARNKGVFRRNYNPDVLSLSKENSTVKLSRNGFLDLIPPGLFAADDELLNGDFTARYEALMRKKTLFEDLFTPENTVFFRTRLLLERKATGLLEEKVGYLLRRYYQYDWSAETNPFVKQIAPLLLMVQKLRADFGFIKNLLRRLLHAEVEMRVGQYTWGEDMEQSQPEIRYDVIIPDLSAEEYKEISDKIEPLKNFLEEWFVPFDTRCVIAVKHHGKPFTLNKGWLLEYNTETLE